LSKIIRYELYKFFTAKKIYVLCFITVALAFLISFTVKVVNTMGDVNQRINVNAQGFPLYFSLEYAGQIMPILCVILFGGLISDEYRDGTLKLALLRPYKRHEVLWAKIFVMFVGVVILLIVAFVSSYAGGLTFLEWGNSFLMDQLSFDYSGFQGIATTLLAYTYTIFPMLAFSLLVLLLSILIDNSGVTIGIGIGVHFLLTILSDYISGIEFLFVNSYYIYGIHFFMHQPAIEWVTAAASIAGYIGLSVLAATKFFAKKDILS